ncbi:CDK5 and ABL1 enzyme substrate 1-like [Porites lutea]|uniref:CDK5 and ABL1 enzyme substrate 1-like n=1 Tax=Porites lutea TaxID=51062 RepID=UPI003CC5CD03
MAAVTAGRLNRRRSKRVASACAFLSSISLDGNVARGPATEVNAKKNASNRSRGNEERNPDLLSSRRPLLHSISEPSALEDHGTNNGAKNSNVKAYHRQRSVTEAVFEGRLQERNVVIRRSVSVSDSTDSASTNSGGIQRSYKHRISCLTGSSFHHKRRATDKRIVLCSSHKAPLVTYSVLKYHKENQEAGQEGMSVKKTSVATPNQVVGIEGVELGSAEKTVSYRSLLISTYPFGWNEGQGTVTPLSIQVDPGGISLDSPDAGFSSPSGYDPHLLDDPELTSGRHRKVLNLASYLVSVVAYARPSELKKDLNEQFKEKFPNLNITLTKLRSLKKDILKIAMTQECQLDLTTVAYAYVYFEKLILKEKISKANRKLLAGSCLLLAAKFNDDMKRDKVREVIEAIEDRLRISVKELLKFEFQAVVALEFDLHVPQWEVMPHAKRLETE